jgi:hypothetical protein
MATSCKKRKKYDLDVLIIAYSMPKGPWSNPRKESSGVEGPAEGSEGLEGSGKE